MCILLYNVQNMAQTISYQRKYKEYKIKQPLDISKEYYFHISDIYIMYVFYL